MWPFRRKPKQAPAEWPYNYTPGTIEHAMVQKDPDLFMLISALPILDAFKVWWTAYPDDFPERGDTVLDGIVARVIKPIQ